MPTIQIRAAGVFNGEPYNDIETSAEVRDFAHATEVLKADLAATSTPEYAEKVLKLWHSGNPANGITVNISNVLNDPNATDRCIFEYMP